MAALPGSAGESLQEEAEPIFGMSMLGDQDPERHQKGAFGSVGEGNAFTARAVELARKHPDNAKGNITRFEWGRAIAAEKLEVLNQACAG
jgi:hypothetical protein